MRDDISAARLAGAGLGLGGLAALNLALVRMGVDLGTGRLLGLSLFQPELPGTGLLFLPAFGLLLFVGLDRRKERGPFGCWLLGLGLILAGNLLQGDPDVAFYQPLYRGGKQYYHDALWIEHARVWLESFGAIQADLGTHARTHPGFATLIHRALAALGGEAALGVTAAAFALIGSLSVPILWRALAEVGAPRAVCARGSVLASVLPAVNIYTAVSLDAVLLTCAALAALALVRIVRDGPRWGSTALLGLATAGANALSFGGSFLLILAALLAAHEAITTGRRRVGIALGIVVAAGVVLWLALASALGYDHLGALLTASRLENPEGFRGRAEPLRYLATRIEGGVEVLVFASLPVALLWLGRLRQPAGAWPERVVSALPACAALSFGALLASGAYQTGETARAALFVYPFGVIALARVDPATLRRASMLCGAQTAAMQLAGSYFW